MARETRIQKKLIDYLKSKGCYVIKTKPGPGIPVGCPDLIFLYEGFWGVIEIKSKKGAPFRPLQKETLQQLASWSYGAVVYPENVEEIIADLELIL